MAYVRINTTATANIFTWRQQLLKQCTIVVKDEVNIKIEGLDLDVRKKLVNEFKYRIPYAIHMPAYKLGRWDGCVSFFQMGGSTYLNLLPDILPILEKYNYNIELEDHRNDYGDLVFDRVNESTFAHKTWPKGHPVAGQPVTLRDYQIDIVNNFLENPQSLQEVATGAGKTLVTAALSASVEKYGRSIVIVPNKSLVVQTEEDYVNLGLDVGVYFGDRKDIGKTHTICTWQSLNSMMKATKNAVAPVTIEQFLEDVICVIVDEVHQAKADALKALLTQSMANVPIRWGLTGTVPKEKYEFSSLHVSLGNVVSRIAASELQDMGVLAQCHVNVLQTQDFKEYSNYQQEMQYLVTDETRLKWLADKINNDVKVHGNTLILVDRINAGEALAELIPGSTFVSGSVKVKDRKETYDTIREGTNLVIIATYGVAAVGINIPRIFNLVLVEPGKSFVRVIQSIGRGIRKAEDKDHVQIWDITSNCKFSKRHLSKRKVFYNDANYPFKVIKVNEY
jgi:superfamily II DNA or RNA helicase